MEKKKMSQPWMSHPHLGLAVSVLQSLTPSVRESAACIRSTVRSILYSIIKVPHRFTYILIPDTGVVEETPSNIPENRANIPFSLPRVLRMEIAFFTFLYSNSIQFKRSIVLHLRYRSPSIVKTPPSNYGSRVIIAASYSTTTAKPVAAKTFDIPSPICPSTTADNPNV